MKQSKLIISFVLLLSTLLSSCGFKLRGFYQIDSALQSLHYDSTGLSTLTRESIKQALQANNIEIVDSPADANFTLRVSSEEVNRQTLTVGTNAKAAEYELQQQFIFEILNQDSAVVYGPSIVKGQRIIQNDPDNYSGQKEEERQQSMRLRRDLVNQLMRRLQSVSKQDLNSQETNSSAE